MNVYSYWPRASRKECRWRVWVSGKMEVARGLAGTREALWGWFGGLIVMCLPRLEWPHDQFVPGSVRTSGYRWGSHRAGVPTGACAGPAAAAVGHGAGM